MGKDDDRSGCITRRSSSSIRWLREPSDCDITLILVEMEEWKKWRANQRGKKRKEVQGVEYNGE